MKAVTFYAVLAVFVLALTGCDNPSSTGNSGNNKWVVTLSVNFDSNGATSGTPPARITVENNTRITIPDGAGLSKPGYYFNGWNTQNDGGGTKYLAGASYTVTGSVRLYVHWTAIPVATLSVDFDSNGAASGTAPASITAEYNTRITIPGGAGLSKPGYYFDGWNTQNDGGGTKYLAGESYTVTGSVRFYAHWTAISGEFINDLFAEVFDELHVAEPVFGRMYTHGATHDVVPVRGSVIHYMFDNLTIDTSRMKSVGGSRPGDVRSNTKYIIYHDTANTTATANALMHANLQYNGYNTASWHYTVDYQNTIYQSIPHNEVAWHAGNNEGNYNSIGIETCVNWGTSQTVYMTDFFQTWQRMGKLVASLLDDYNLPLSAVLSHKEISEIGYGLGQATYVKCCPATLRHATLYEMAKDMIRCELLYLQKVQKAGYTAQIIIDPDSAEYIDEKGRVKKLPPVETTVHYTIRLTAPGGETREKEYSSVLRPQSMDYVDRCDITVGTCAFNSYASIPAASSILISRILSWRSLPARHTHDDTTICDITWGDK